MITLRYYQKNAVEAAWKSLRNGQHPVIELPTASGKSAVCGELSRRVLEKNGRVLVVTHVQELVSSNAAEFQKMSDIEPGILCAGLARTDKNHDVLFASVQSIYRPMLRGEIPPFDLIIVDEAHLVSDQDSDAKFYPSLFKTFTTASRIGLSATPSRMSVPIWGEGKWFTERCIEVSVLELVENEYLCPLVGVSTDHKIDVDKLSHTAGEFDIKSIEKQETKEWLTQVAKTSKVLAEGRKHILVFCPSVSTAEEAAKCFTEVGLPAEYVVADTDDRDGKLSRWKAGEFPVMCNVSILTTGFNFPKLDCGVILRPTESQELWRQMLGRFTRTADGKKNALILDFSQNLAIHGGICVGMEEVYEQTKTGFKPASAKPKERQEKRKIKTAKDLSDLDPMMASPKGFRARVLDIGFVVINSKQKPGKRLVMCNYDCVTDGGLLVTASLFLCVEYQDYALQMAAGWFRRRGEDNFPRNAESARAFCWGLPVPREVTIKKNGRYLNIVAEHF